MVGRLIVALLFIAASIQAQEKSILYKVSGNGLEKPSYLMGIINFLPADQFSVPPAVDKAMEECEIYAAKFEQNRKTQKKFNDAVKIPNNGWINDYLTDDELNQLRLLLLLDMEVKEHAYHDFYSRLQPIILVPTTTALKLGDNIVYTEHKLHEVAKKHKLKTESLGTIQEEINAFEKFPIEDQVEALKHTVNNFDQHIQDYEAMVADYLKNQDLVKVKNETFKATNESQLFKKVYYDSRALSWLPKIEEMMKDKPTFIALGAPYLVGDVSLLNLLETKGYVVSPVKVSF
ncbi:MAG: TraB/GumN family protein [Fulvivirga sp.]|uniref:TraB/GumN family protein n=1 Tax=Fulvivirga sp. TaxID=1931237 RepID=UPI0032EB8C3D